MKLKIVLEKSDEDGYTVYVPSLPGCISEGDTEEEAIEKIREAIELYLESFDDVLSTTTQEPVIREITILPLESREKEAIGIEKKKLFREEIDAPQELIDELIEYEYDFVGD